MISKDYPYMYARVSAKKAKLLDSDQYENFLKMSPSEIARNLEEGDYKEDINELGSKYNGVELVDLALIQNVSRTMAKLIEIAPDKLEPVIRAYLRRYDILSLKRLLRWKRGGGDGLRDLLMPVGHYSHGELMEMSEKEYEELCDMIEFPESCVDYQSYIEDADNLKEIERNLDRAYYEDLRETCNSIGSMWFEKFIGQEAEYENMKIALRLKNHGLGIEEMREWAVTEKISKKVERIMNSDDLEAAINILKEEGVIDVESSNKTLENVEHSLEVARLAKALRTLHLEPLGATSILGYIVAKLVEVKNLRMLVRAKETGIQNPETIRKNLVVS